METHGICSSPRDQQDNIHYFRDYLHFLGQRHWKRPAILRDKEQQYMRYSKHQSPANIVPFQPLRINAYKPTVYPYSDWLLGKKSEGIEELGYAKSKLR